MIASIYWILLRLYDIIYSLINGSFYYDIIGSILYILLLVVPISILILSINLNKLTSTNNDEIKPEIIESVSTELTIGNWILNIFLTSIPLVGLILMIVWATDKSNINRKNWAVARLIWAGIISVLSIIIGLIVALANM
tara:strand:- start:3000 stop:3416 length:417 start_codon:yes stop_codon:yes gene_type:complete